jgi:hypothetical protein
MTSRGRADITAEDLDRVEAEGFVLGDATGGGLAADHVVDPGGNMATCPVSGAYRRPGRATPAAG